MIGLLMFLGFLTGAVAGFVLAGGLRDLDPRPDTPPLPPRKNAEHS